MSRNLVPQFYCIFNFRNIGAKLEHFKKLQGKLEFHQNKCHHGNAPDMRRQCAKATDQSAPGVVGRPNSLSGWPTFVACRGFASRPALHEAVTRNPKLEVSGSWTRWLAGRTTPGVLPT
jgi:hypothetical protein